MYCNYFGSSSLTDIILFQRFKTEWVNINQEKFQNNYFEVDLQTKQKVTSFCLSKLEEMHARDDSKEFLQLALITMGTIPCTSKDEESYHFIAPGTTHRARWMAKAIHTLKIGLFHKQFILTKKEASAVKSMYKFVVKCYSKQWFLSQTSLCVPRVDLELLKILAKEECYQPAL